MKDVMATALSTVTLGVSDMDRARAYYGSIFETVDPPGTPGPCYVRTAGTWLALYPRQKLARYFGVDDTSTQTAGFGGIALSINVEQPDDVDALCERLRLVGGRVSVEPGPASWGGRIACVADPDGHLLELVFNPKRC